MGTKPPVDLQSSFGDILKKEFGTGVPQLATVVAVVLGSLGLQEYFNAGAWTVVAVLCFALVYLYRRQFPNRLGKTTVGVVVFVIVLAIGGYLVLRISAANQSVPEWIKNHKTAVTAYCSFVITTVIACLITSYRKQEEMQGMTYPRSIENAITDQLYSLDFFKENVKFLINVAAVEGEWVKFVTEHSYTVVNRSNSEKTWRTQYNFNRQTGKVLQAKIDKENIDVEDPHYMSGVGLDIPRKMEPAQKSDVYMKIEERFRLQDSGIYTSFHPATDLKVVVHNSVSGLKTYFELLHFSDPTVVTEKNDKTISVNSGLLPFQGVIMQWRTD